MKSKSKLQNLSPEDQQYILDLCNHNPYEDVVPILEQPRPVGLSIKTSVSALCRFYNRVNPLGLRAEITGQLADGLHLRQLLSGPAFNSALLTLVQVHLLQGLKDGKSIDNLQPAFRILHNLQRNWLAFEKLRATSDDDTLEMHKHDEAILENQPDFTEIPPSREVGQAPRLSSAGVSPAEPAPLAPPERGEGRGEGLPLEPTEDAETEPVDQNQTTRENIPPNSSEKTPQFHLFHQIPPAENLDKSDEHIAAPAHKLERRKAA